MCSNKGVTKSHQSAGWWWSSTRLPNEERAWSDGPRIILRPLCDALYRPQLADNMPHEREHRRRPVQSSPVTACPILTEPLELPASCWVQARRAWQYPIYTRDGHYCCHYCCLPNLVTVA